MRLEGIHHVTAITGDAPGNVDFYTRVLGLRLVAKTVNQDDPTVYHLFYADEHGSPGADMTFFEYPGAPPGRAGARHGAPLVWRVASPEALDFWAERLAAEGIASDRDGDRLRFADPEGLGHELVVDPGADAARGRAPEIPAEHAIGGLRRRARVQPATPSAAARLLEDALAATASRRRRAGAARRQARPRPSPSTRRPSAGVPGAGTVHHVAWGTTVAEHPRWLERPGRERACARRP